MSDLFDNEVSVEWFVDAWESIIRAPNCRIQIVTKRISMVEKRLQQCSYSRWPQHAGLIISIVNQAEADRDIPRLLALKAKLGIPWVGLSMEPLLGHVDLRTPLYTGPGGITMQGFLPNREEADDFHFFAPKLDWVIVASEPTTPPPPKPRR